MIFQAEILQHPIAYESENISDITALFQPLNTQAQAALAAVAGCSPYLYSLLISQNRWLLDYADHPPQEIFDKILADCDQSDNDIATSLRLAKKRVSLLLALCDLFGIWHLEKITRCLSEFADLALNKACQKHINKAVRRNILPKFDDDNFSGLCVLAMGKMGAYELNYSSDIDLIFLFDDRRYNTINLMRYRTAFIKITRLVLKTLSEHRADGYVFRTDLRLRPNPSVTPICIAISQAKTYYLKEGRTWERAAFIKARVAAGNNAAGRYFLCDLENFIWRNALDFAAQQEINAILQKARCHKNIFDTDNLYGYDIKMGYGGIREIEFFAQTKQLTFGGRDNLLRSRQTVQTLRNLAIKRHIQQETCDTLIRVYRHHRRLEHRIQMIRDAQIHSLPPTEGGLKKLAYLSGQKELKQFKKNIISHLKAANVINQPHKNEQHRFSSTLILSTVPKHTKKLIKRMYRYSALRSPIAKKILPSFCHKFFAMPKPLKALMKC